MLLQQKDQEQTFSQLEQHVEVPKIRIQVIRHQGTQQHKEQNIDAYSMYQVS